MMTSVSNVRALARSRPFGTARPRVASHITCATPSGQFAPVNIGTKNRSFMVEVEVFDDEPEDQAVRRYMKLVMDSRVLEKLRARKVKETKIETYKRRFRERVELRKAGFEEPTYQELYGEIESRPFDDFFTVRDPDDPEGAYDGLALAGEEVFGTFSGGNYVDSWAPMNQNAQTGGYIGGTANYGNTSNWQGGYM